MPRGQKSQACKLEKGLQAQSNLEEVSAAEMPSTSQGPQSAYSCSTAQAAAPWSLSDQGSSRQGEEGPGTSQLQPDAESMLRDEIFDKVAELVTFLLVKYRMKEPFTRAEVLEAVIQDHQDHFSVIFGEASECLQLVFGIDVKKVHPAGQCYVLVSTLGLTYDETLSDSHSMPKTGLLVTVLGVIFLEGNRVPEKEIWKLLSVMGVYPGREHFIYGEPRKLLTRDWVQEQYLEYRQIPGSEPACYEFLWGPRAHAETSKMKVLEGLAKVYGTVPSAFSTWYEEALRDEEERAMSRAISGASSSGLPSP